METRRDTRNAFRVRDGVSWMQSSVHNDLLHGRREGDTNGPADFAGSAAGWRRRSDASKAVVAASGDLLSRAPLEELSEGKRIETRGSGVLTVKGTAAEPTGRNPRASEIIAVPARLKAHSAGGGGY